MFKTETINNQSVNDKINYVNQLFSLYGEMLNTNSVNTSSNTEAEYTKYVEYVCTRLEVLKDLVAEPGAGLGPEIEITFADYIMRIENGHKYLWPHIAPNYQGGLILTWSSATTTVSFELPRDEGSIGVTIMTSEKINQGPAGSNYIANALISISKRVLANNPGWKLKMLEQVGIV